jgi:NADH pyrophosphatase NudC (nudix superfamily)
MHALEREPQARPQNAAEWFEELNGAVSKRPETPPSAESPLIVMAPQGSEVYVDDERHGSVGRSGRVVLRSIVPGQHVLRVSRTGEVDDERIIEVRADGIEQIIQAQFKSAAGSEHLSPSRGGSLDSRTGATVSAPHVVACTQCGSRFAEGIKFCGRCGNRSFERVGTSELKQAVIANLPGGAAATMPCPRCHTQYPAGIRFCGKCGIPIGSASLDWRPPRSVEVVCKSCSTSYAPGTKFCGRCGKPLNV